MSARSDLNHDKLSTTGSNVGGAVGWLGPMSPEDPSGAGVELVASWYLVGSVTVVHEFPVFGTLSDPTKAHPQRGPALFPRHRIA